MIDDLLRHDNDQLCACSRCHHIETIEDQEEFVLIRDRVWTSESECRKDDITLLPPKALDGIDSFPNPLCALRLKYTLEASDNERLLCAVWSDDTNPFFPESLK